MILRLYFLLFETKPDFEIARWLGVSPVSSLGQQLHSGRLQSQVSSQSLLQELHQTQGEWIVHHTISGAPGPIRGIATRIRVDGIRRFPRPGGRSGSWYRTGRALVMEFDGRLAIPDPLNDLQARYMALENVLVEFDNVLKEALSAAAGAPPNRKRRAQAK